MRIVLDRPRCEGHGLCEEAAPALMHLDDDGELVIDQEEFEPGSADERPPRRCPRLPRGGAQPGMTAPRRIVIVGNGIAGVTAADTLPRGRLRRRAHAGRGRGAPAYSRPRCPRRCCATKGPHRATCCRRRRTARGDARSSGHGLDPAADGDPRLGGAAVVRRTRRRHGLPSAAARQRQDEGELRCARSRTRWPCADGSTRGVASSSSAAAPWDGDRIRCLEAGCDVTVVSPSRPWAQLGAHLSELFVKRPLAAGCASFDWVPPATASGTDPGRPRGRLGARGGGRRHRHRRHAQRGVAGEQRAAARRCAQRGRARSGGSGGGRRGRRRDRADPPRTAPRPAVERGDRAEQGRRRDPVGVGCGSVEARPYFWTDQFGLSLKAVGHLPFVGEPEVSTAVRTGGVLLQWPAAGSARGRRGDQLPHPHPEAAPGRRGRFRAAGRRITIVPTR